MVFALDNIMYFLLKILWNQIINKALNERESEKSYYALDESF